LIRRASSGLTRFFRPAWTSAWLPQAARPLDAVHLCVAAHGPDDAIGALPSAAVQSARVGEPDEVKVLDQVDPVTPQLPGLEAVGYGRCPV
jgi:hypothetical protein